MWTYLILGRNSCCLLPLAYWPAALAARRRLWLYALWVAAVKGFLISRESFDHHTGRPTSFIRVWWTDPPVSECWLRGKAGGHTPRQLPRSVLAIVRHALAATTQVPMAACTWQSDLRAPPRIGHRLRVPSGFSLGRKWLQRLRVATTSCRPTRDLRRLSLTDSMHKTGSEQDAS